MGACFSDARDAAAAAGGLSMEQCVARLVEGGGVSLPKGTRLHIDNAVVRATLANAGLDVTWAPYQRILPRAGAAPREVFEVRAHGPDRFAVSQLSSSSAAAAAPAAAALSMDRCVATIAAWGGASLPQGAPLHIDSAAVRDALAAAGLQVTWAPYKRIEPPAGVVLQGRATVRSNFSSTPPTFDIMSLTRA